MVPERLSKRSGEHASSHRGKVLQYLPFLRSTFVEISQRLFIHGSITSVINRGDVATFSRLEVEIGEAKVPLIGLLVLLFRNPASTYLLTYVLPILAI